MTWKEGFYAALLRFVREDLRKYGAEEVTEFTQREVDDYSDSSYAVIEITYRDHDGKLRLAEWEGDFAGLIGRLTE